MWRSNVPEYKGEVNTHVVISQLHPTHISTRRHKTTLKMFKMFITVFLVLSISMMVKSKPATTLEEFCNGTPVFNNAIGKFEQLCVQKFCVFMCCDPEPKCTFEEKNKVIGG